MATEFEKLLGKDYGHELFYFTSIKHPREIEGGAICTADIDNGTLVEKYFVDGEEEPRIRPISANTTKGLICYTQEVLHVEGFETKTGFFNGAGEAARIYVQEQMVSFKTTAFNVKDAGKTIADVKKGWYAIYNATTKKYDLTATAPGEADGVNTYNVIEVCTDDVYELLGKDCVHLEIR